MAHDSIQRAWDLIDQANDTLDRAAIASAERPFDEPDALEKWSASMPKKEEGNRMSQLEMIAALARHEAAKHLRETDAVTKAEMHAHTQRALENFAALLGEEVALTTNEQFAKMQAEIETLRRTIVELRADLLQEPIDIPKLKLIGEGR